jgi:hypothetical protein
LTFGLKYSPKVTFIAEAPGPDPLTARSSATARRPNLDTIVSRLEATFRDNSGNWYSMTERRAS